MQDISRFFNRISKKVDLSNNSNNGKASKKPRQRSLNTSTSSEIPDDLFTVSLKDTECVTILLNCIKKIERQITQILDNTNELKEKQFKDKSHLLDLRMLWIFLPRSLINTKQEKKHREEIINNLTENFAKLIQNVDDLSNAVEKLEQYSRRNCLLLSGTPKKK